MRLAVEQELGFTVSAGIASNKVLAKLASSINKPNKQVREEISSPTGAVHSRTAVRHTCAFYNSSAEHSMTMTQPYPGPTRQAVFFPSHLTSPFAPTALLFAWLTIHLPCRQRERRWYRRGQRQTCSTRSPFEASGAWEGSWERRWSRGARPRKRQTSRFYPSLGLACFWLG